MSPLFTVRDLPNACLFLHTPSTSANHLPEATVYCEAETTEFLSWPNTPAGTTASIQCPSSTIIINRTCSLSAVWESVDPSLCTIFSSINIVSVIAELDIDSQSHVHFSFMHDVQWQDNITLGNYEEVFTILSGAVTGAAINEEQQTASSLAIVAAAFSRSAALINETTIIPNTVRYCFLSMWQWFKPYFLPSSPFFRRCKTWSTYWRACNSGMRMCCGHMPQSEHYNRMITLFTGSPQVTESWAGAGNKANKMSSSSQISVTKQLKQICHFLVPCSIVRSFEVIVSVFARQLEDGDCISFMTEYILFVAELVSWVACEHGKACKSSCFFQQNYVLLHLALLFVCGNSRYCMAESFCWRKLSQNGGKEHFHKKNLHTLLTGAAKRCLASKFHREKFCK